MNKRLLSWGGLLSFVCLGAIVACSSSSDGGGAPTSPSNTGTSPTGTSTDTPAGGDTVTTHITAANGGTVTDKDGKATLTIPAGALSADTDITLKVAPKTGDAVTDILTFGPDGLQFTKPATLAIKADASLAPAGKTLAVALQGGDGKFAAIAGSTYASGAASAPIAHFSSYTIVIIDGQAVLQTPADCPAATADFKPCGGDPKGSWKFSNFCIDPKALGADPFQGKCTGFVATADITIDRTVTIDATTLVTGAGTQTTKFSYSFPASCAAPDGGTAPACSQFGGDDTTCTGTTDCSCIGNPKVDQKEASTSTYTTSGNTITITDPGEAPQTGDYCVSGDVLAFRNNPTGNDPQVVYYLARQ